MINNRPNECFYICNTYLDNKDIQEETNTQTTVSVEVSAQSKNSMTDIDYINVGLNHDAIFRKYWNGDRPLGDESADDMALIGKLKFWANGNDELIAEMFLKSPHAQTKDKKHMEKIKRKDYLKMTIDNCSCKTYARTKDAEYQRRKRE